MAVRSSVVLLAVTGVLFTIPMVSVASGEVTANECRAIAGRAPTLSAKMVRVVDGDTVKISVSGKQLSVRMLSIDTPEKNFQGKSQGVWAERATEFLDDQVEAGENVTIEFEGERCDKYGRLLGHVHAGGVNLNKLVLQQGLAVNYCIYPNIGHCAEYGAIVAKNIRAGKGIFGDDSVEIPYIWRRTVSNQDWDKFTGNMETKQVFQPEDMDEVPVELRIFFMSEDDIVPPYHL